MILDLMPAELVAKLVYDEDQLKHRLEIKNNECSSYYRSADIGVRHAWIEAAQALEEMAIQATYHTLAYRGGAWKNVAVLNNDVRTALRAAARDLRKAAEEDVEP